MRAQLCKRMQHCNNSLHPVPYWALVGWCLRDAYNCSCHTLVFESRDPVVMTEGILYTPYAYKISTKLHKIFIRDTHAHIHAPIIWLQPLGM